MVALRFLSLPVNRCAKLVCIMFCGSLFLTYFMEFADNMLFRIFLNCFEKFNFITFSVKIRSNATGLYRPRPTFNAYVSLHFACYRTASSSYVVQNRPRDLSALSKSSLKPVSPTPIQHTVSMSQSVTSQESSTSSSSVTTSLTSLSPSSWPESQPADVTDDDILAADYFGLRKKLLPVDASIHLCPPDGSYQPFAFSCHTSLHSTTTAATVTSSSVGHSKWRLNSCRREGHSDTSVTRTLSMETPALTQSPRGKATHLHHDVTPTTSDVTPSPADVKSTSCDVDYNNNAEAGAASRETALSKLTHSDAVAVQQLETSPAATCGSQDEHSTTGQCDEEATQHDDNNIYEKLQTGRQRYSGELSGYTALRAQRARDSVMSDVSYESIAWWSLTRTHTAAPTTVNNDDDMSTLSVGDYLHTVA